MTQHEHIKAVEGCYRCELGRDEAMSSVVEELIDAVTNAIDLILPKSTVMMRGNGWKLERDSE